MIELRKITEQDTHNIVKWRNQKFVKRNLFTQTDLSAEQHNNWLKAYVQTGMCSQYIIVAYENGVCKDIGTTFIKNIDGFSKKGEFGIFIGEKEYLGRGYGKIATKLMLDIAFSELNLHRVYLYVMSDNVAAIKAYESVGFVVEGVLRQDFFRDGSFIDIVMMGKVK